MSRQTQAQILAGAAIVLLAWPAPARAQRIKIDAKVDVDVSREIREALRGVSQGLNEALRDIDRDLSHDLGRDLTLMIGRGVERGLRELPRMAEYGDWDGRQDRDMRGSATDRQTKTLAIGPDGTLEVTNISGDITVNVGSGRDVVVDVMREARGRTDAEARQSLDRVQAMVEARGTRGTVKTDYGTSRQSNARVSVDYVITAPAGTRLVINSISGDVKVTGVKGDLSVNSASGDVVLVDVGSVLEAKTASGDVSITGSSSDGTLDAGSLNGDVTLTRVKARRITISTVSGDVVARDVNCESAEMNTLSGDAVYTGEIARNGHYQLTSHSGDIRFAPTGSVGYTVSANSFGGEITGAVQFSGDSRSRMPRRREVTGKVGDGSATVTLQTFNGDISVGGRRQ